jgi:hypothetical protein
MVEFAERRHRPLIEYSRYTNPGRITPKPSACNSPSASSAGGGSGLAGLFGAMIRSLDRNVTSQIR